MKPVKMIIICGYPGVGKTTIADKLAMKLGYILLNVDDIWDFISLSIVSENNDRGKIAYTVLQNLIMRQISLGNSVIVDVPFTHNWLREALFSIAKEYHAEIHIIYCYCSDDIAIKRNLERIQLDPKRFSERDVANFYRIKQNYVSIDGIVNIKINTEDEPIKNVKKIIEYLEQKN